jgi:hypothetical protein
MAAAPPPTATGAPPPPLPPPPLLPGALPLDAQPPPLPTDPSALGLQLLATHVTTWSPDGVGGRAGRPLRVAMNLALDGAIVPTLDGAARTDYTRVIVFDNFLDDATRRELLDFLTAPGWAGPEPPGAQWERATCDAAPDAGGGGGDHALEAAPAGGASGARDQPPPAPSGRGRVDGGAEGGAGWSRHGEVQRQRRTWGLRDSALRRFAASALPAKLEVQSRLCKLYPEAWIAHMPSTEIQWVAGGEETGAGECEGPPVDAAGGAAAGAEASGAAARAAVGQPVAAAAGGAGVAGNALEAGRGARTSKRPRLEARVVPANDHAQPDGGGGASSSAGDSDSTSGRGSDDQGGEDGEGWEEEVGGGPLAVHCAQFVANAAVAGDCFSWHVDADPATFPDSPWVERAGR